MTWKETLKKKELVGNQKKLDRNKNGKLDAEDFKMLREEKEIEKADMSMLKTLIMEKLKKEGGAAGLRDLEKVVRPHVKSSFNVKEFIKRHMKRTVEEHRHGDYILV